MEVIDEEGRANARIRRKVRPLQVSGQDERSGLMRIDKALVIALCPNCHREAHHGENKERIYKEMLLTVEKVEKRQ